ncbi:hypothetical protein HMY34_19640 [Thiothrix subterranea]|uniref:hypothetical protein n=1 Tax=Thiothrix subterranea TaxID=2735563 RepID=UPI00192BF5DC|nr:hypothetical protein [Thiothrix subterranea]QQZ30788.1 hypothetical protein HMY34_19640 [Thiothrix subterranea]
MDINQLKAGIPDLLMQGLLFEVKEGMSNAKEPQKVLTVNLLQTQHKLRNGEEFTGIETRLLGVRDESTFGAFIALQGQFVSIPVGMMVREGSAIFWVPKGMTPKLVNPVTQPMPASSALPKQ